MTTGVGEASNEAGIRTLIDAQIKAVRARDVDASMSNYAADIVSFDVVNTLQKIGLDECRKRAEEWFSSFQGPIEYEISELSVSAGGTLAFSHSLNHVNATNNDGKKIDMWWRATAGYRKIDDRWMITHEHMSVPFDVQSGKASLDLKP